MTLRRLIQNVPSAFEPPAFWAALQADTAAAEATCGSDGNLSARLSSLADNLHLFPLDLQDLCNGTGAMPDEAWPFAAAMFARGPHLVEATMLSAVNVGGAAAAVGALAGSLFGALHGPECFPAAWPEGLAARAAVEAAAQALT